MQRIQTPKYFDRSLGRLAVAALMLVAACTPAERQTSLRDYNVVLVTIDTLRADHVGAYGSRSTSTPTLDALAASGVRFAAAQSAVPLTLPSHTTLLTGLLPLHHGLRNNGAATLAGDVPTLASILASAGYRTGAFVGAFVLDHRFGLNRGFEKYDDEIVRDPTENTTLEAERPAVAVVDRALTWLDSTDARPFFAWVHLYDPHAPYAPPEPYRTRRANDLYSGEVEYADNQLQRIVDALEAKGVAKRTIIIVAGDHGEALGEHGEATHGLLLYEPTLHVPLIMRAPGALKTRVVQTPMSLTDVAPTIAALVGHPMNGALDGRDLSANLLNGDEPPPADLYAETEYPRNFGWSGLAALRRGSMKYIAAPAPELYDLARDATEMRNIRDEARRDTVALSKALDALRQSAKSQSKTVADDETRRKLASLGYVSAGAAVNATNADPKTMAPLFGRFEQSIFALAAGHVVEATKELQRLVDADPHNPVFRATLARTLRRQGDLSRAIANYKEVVVTTPSDADAWYNLAATLHDAARNDEAAQVIAEALRLDPKRAEAHNTNGIIKLDERKPEEALAEFRKAAELDPRDARAFNNMGNLLRDMGEPDRAEAAFRSALAVAPDYADALNGLAAILVQKDRPAEALPLFDRVLREHDDFVEARLNRGIALQLMGNHASAAVEYERVLRETAGRARVSRQHDAAQQLLARLPDRVDHNPIR